MHTTSRTHTPTLRLTAVVALTVLALLAIPMAARAAGRVCSPGIVLAGRLWPVAGVPHSSHVLAAHRHRLAPLHDHLASDDGFRWSLYDGETHSTCGASDEEIRDVVGAIGGDQNLLWFSSDGERWVIRDRALVGRAHAGIQPMQQLGQEMGRIGARQGIIGAERGRLGARQGTLATRLAMLRLRDDDDPAIEREAGAIERELRALAKEAIASRRAERVGERGDL